jgi:uncharacterized protein YecT (DUF1311 family)
VITALLLLAAGSPDAMDCDGNAPQQMLNICAAEAAQRVDEEMNAQWKLAAAAMKKSDTGVDRKYDREPGYFVTLLAAQRAWLTYRDQQCLVESFELRGGSGAPQIHSGCMYRLTRERLAQLKALIETGN